MTRVDSCSWHHAAAVLLGLPRTLALLEAAKELVQHWPQWLSPLGVIGRDGVGGRKPMCRQHVGLLVKLSVVVEL